MFEFVIKREYEIGIDNAVHFCIAATPSFETNIDLMYHKGQLEKIVIGKNTELTPEQFLIFKKSFMVKRKYQNEIGNVVYSCIASGVGDNTIRIDLIYNNGLFTKAIIDKNVELTSNYFIILENMCESGVVKNAFKPINKTPIDSEDEETRVIFLRELFDKKLIPNIIEGFNHDAIYDLISSCHITIGMARKMIKFILEKAFTFEDWYNEYKEEFFPSIQL